MCRELPPAIQTIGRSQRTESDNPQPSGMADFETVSMSAIAAIGLSGRLIYVQPSLLSRSRNTTRSHGQPFTMEPPQCHVGH